MGGRQGNTSAAIAWLSSVVVHLAVAIVLGLILLPLCCGHRERLTLVLSTVERASPVELFNMALPAVEFDVPPAITPSLPLDMRQPSVEWPVTPADGAPGGMLSSSADDHTGLHANYFGATASGNRFVYALDMSTSMNEPTGYLHDSTRFRDAMGELVRSVDALTEQQSFYVFLFCYQTRRNFDDRAPIPRMIPATPKNKLRLRAWLATIKCAAGTDPRTSLYNALRMQPDAIFLLSDGDFNGRRNGRKCSAMAGNPSVMRIIKTQNRGHCPIHALALVNDANQRLMSALARATGGSYRLIPDMADGRRHVNRRASSLWRMVNRPEQRAAHE